jgi:hypothetical protein
MAFDWTRNWLALFAFAGFAANVCSADKPGLTAPVASETAGGELFEKRIRPLFIQHCYWSSPRVVGRGEACERSVWEITGIAKRMAVGCECPGTTEGSRSRLTPQTHLTRVFPPSCEHLFPGNLLTSHGHWGNPSLVQTPSNFGKQGKPPTHPELLDYLANRFIASGWSLKAMHRLKMLSRTYQLSSRDDAANARLDAANDYLWHFRRRRLEAECLRDTLLAVSGTLDRSMAGPHPFPDPQK